MKEAKTTPLRQRMIADMRMRGMAEKAQAAHIRAVKDFALFLKRSPDTATPGMPHGSGPATGICLSRFQEDHRMAGKRETPEDLVPKRRQVEGLQGQGKSVSDAVRQIGVTVQTACRWRKDYGRMNRDQLKPLGELEI